VILALLTVAAAGAIAAAALLFVRTRDLDIWGIPYLRYLLEAKEKPSGPVHILLAVTDHFEPRLGGVSYERECERVRRWSEGLPALAAKHRDSDGHPYQHSFFYPEEEYRAEHLDALAALCRAGYGDVEIHLHHDHDTAAGLREKLERFKRTLHEGHGLLRRNPATGVIEYAFIHGNWALDNSDGGRNCGVDNELQVLRETGCYADFTFPSTPSRTQPRKINSVYYATDDPLCPKSHDRGVDVAVGKQAAGDLLLIEGPLTFNMSSRKLGVLPRIENAEISGDNPPSPERADLWVRHGVRVKGRPEWVFIKLHTHGCNEPNTAALLGGALDRTLTYLEQTYNDGTRYLLHYVTAREMYNIIKAAEAGADGNPGRYRPDATPVQASRPCV
jgi:hypothetical protein